MIKTQIRIQNIGPIKDVDFKLDKINVFMGEQSSGKSTIAKIISYCQWVEKRFLLDGEYDYDFKEQFLNFHKIDENYFTSNSLFKYESEFIEIAYEGKNYKQTIKNKNKNLEYLKSKNIYIPAERNFVSVIPNLSKFKETTDNIMSFLYDWYDAKEKYAKDNSLSILNLGVEYYHVDETDSDVLTLKGNNREISLKNASSGFQSIIPLAILIDYLTGAFYKVSKSNSINEKESIEKLVAQVLQEYKKSQNSRNEEYSSDEVKLILDLVKNKADYHYTNFIIEEPEQNLFPKTQKDLIYNLLNKLNSTQRRHTLTLTTHSPYILYALNNCIMASILKDRIPDSEKQKLQCFDSKINPNSISIYEIKNGKIENIQQKDGLIGENFFDNQMKEVMDEFYLMLNHY